MKRDYLSPVSAPPAIRATMAKIADREDRRLPVYDFGSGNAGRLPGKFNLFTKLDIEVNKNLPESLHTMAESLKNGLMESFNPTPAALSYSPTGGIPSTRKLALKYFKDIHGIPLSNDELDRVIVTAGGQQALVASLKSLRKGTSILMLRWDYDAASGTVRAMGSKEIRVDVKDDLSIDVLDLEKKIEENSVFYLSMPNNPTGYTSPSDLKDIVESMIQHNGAVVWDAPYLFTILRMNSKKAVFDDEFLKSKQEEFKKISSKYYEHMCVLSSLSKTCLIAGLRFGMATACPEWVESINTFVGRDNLSSPTGSLILGTAVLRGFLEKPLTHIWTCKILANRLTILMEELDGYLMLPTNKIFGALYSLVRTPIDGDKFSTKLIDEYGIVTVPGSAFYGEPVKVVRLSLVALPWTEGDERWIENVRELKKALKSS